MQSPIIISLGGSAIVPRLSNSGGINTVFLKKFQKLIEEKLKEGKKFVVIVGGGKTTRVYQKAAEQISKVEKEDVDWLGIHATRLNAHLLRTVFRKSAYPIILDSPQKPLLRNKKKDLIFAAGWKPGFSTDFDAVLLAKRFKAKELINATNISHIYDKDPRIFKDAAPIKKISFSDYQKLIPSEWTPGLSAPFDPIATKMAKKLGIKIKIVKATNLNNFERVIEGKEFEGTLIY